MSEEKTVKWEEVKRKIALKQKVEKAKAKAAKAWEWCLDNPMLAMAGLGAVTSLVSKGARAYNTHAEDVRRRRDFYDTRTGKHVIAKRDLKIWESDVVDERFRGGESYAQIFRDLNIPRKA